MSANEIRRLIVEAGYMTLAQLQAIYPQEEHEVMAIYLTALIQTRAIHKIEYKKGDGPVEVLYFHQ